MLLPEKFKEKFDIPKSKGSLQKALQLQLIKIRVVLLYVHVSSNPWINSWSQVHSIS
jgi:hypothetical protein